MTLRVDRNVRPPKSRPAASLTGEKTARRDSAVHVSLSSDSPVKQPGTEPVPFPSKEGRRSPRFRDHRKLVHRISVRSFAGAPSRRSRQRAVRAVYRTRPRTLSTPKPAESARVPYFSTLTRTAAPAGRHRLFFSAGWRSLAGGRKPLIRQNWRRTEATFLGRC